ncbi:nucleoside 2-deoxyribosyltransferase [Amycolatopsis roodepoortensis]|uniref:nucleoside 2-deoxyribosyltransferase n=1 Tax=Amycolatopsis roodepoortensis TaxID=700274 RepID=UPI00214CCECC|nr:nucleoside 2-deoxyribosyltransferase [Amycolatopsis roodepoortensis]UUV32295.1 nucleoside 2-deoxyribosyltransferase [Amycolatopsis roodepoortensis]
MATEGRVLVHFDSDRASVYRSQRGELTMLQKQPLAFDEHGAPEALAERIAEFCAGLTDVCEVVNNKTTRLYATGAFQQLPHPQAAALINAVYVDTGLYLNIVAPELEQFYLHTGRTTCGSDAMLEGLTRREIRKAVVCGSFQQSLGYIEGVIARLRGRGSAVLSPPSTRVKPETEGTDFILFDYQDFLKNERDTWRHKYVHLDTFRQADAVVVCNPGGRVGKGTIFELGFMSALSKRVIFTEEPQGISVFFPCEVGLDA